jgi:hypothetical protein
VSLCRFHHRQLHGGGVVVERMDYVYAMDVLVQRASAPRPDVPAETGGLGRSAAM